MGNIFQILICDDDDISLKVNRTYVEAFSKKYKKSVCIHECSEMNANLKKIIQSGKIDIAFLDIDLANEKQGDGISIARKLQEKNKDIPIIFISNHGEYKAAACDILAVGYLPKPIIQEKFGLLYKRALIQAEDNKKGEEEKFINVMVNRKETRILVSQIITVEKLQRKILIKSRNEIWETVQTMHTMEGMLPDYFLRISQSVIINTREMIQNDRRNIQISTGETFPIGITYAKKVENAMTAV